MSEEILPRFGGIVVKALFGNPIPTTDEACLIMQRQSATTFGLWDTRERRFIKTYSRELDAVRDWNKLEKATRNSKHGQGGKVKRGSIKRLIDMTVYDATSTEEDNN